MKIVKNKNDLPNLSGEYSGGYCRVGFGMVYDVFLFIWDNKKQEGSWRFSYHSKNLIKFST